MKKLADIQHNFVDWYQDVIFEAELVDSSPTKGCYVLRPYGFALWENIQKILDKEIKKTGTQNAYFPLLIPESFITKEKKHVEGFSPELAVVTHAGGEKLEEAYVVRPTSETIIYHMFARWIKSWRDLPLKINQWANVVRWEMRHRAFLRSVEFLWQEGHTAHATHGEAVEMAQQALAIYKKLLEHYYAIPVISGMKTESEKFAGAERTYTLESLMPDGKALQMCTSHVLGHSFPESFDVRFQDDKGTMQVPHCTSWGLTTRTIGALVMMHGDQQGLIIPPRLAPIQAVIIPIYKTAAEKTAIIQKANEVAQHLQNANIAVHVDLNENDSPGAKFYAWELKGVPVRIELGPKDLEKNHVVMVNRAEADKTKKKQFVPCDNLITTIQALFDTIHEQLYQKALQRIQQQWHQADALSDFAHALENENGLYQTGWCGDAACEAQLKEHKGTIRCRYHENAHITCFYCKKPSVTDVLIAKSY
ncbi:MAG: Proline-tRNA ligase [candidate division TM6 bacterium GW2011_GWF2_38_10]|nr:MAG: Proline-tRNA ligase [candidate division TM6 bacterium GW2011_GWF2_38_10]